MTELTAMNNTRTNDKAKIFISYSRDDVDFADQFVTALEAFGFDPLIDRHSIPGGEDWKSQLRHMIVEADSVVFILSPRSATSKLCEWEVEEADQLNKRLIPIVCAPLGGVSVPPRLANLNYIFFYAEPKSSGSGFGSGLARLTAALNTDLDWIRDHTRLGALAERWQSRSRDRALLLRGDELTDAERWLAGKPPKAPEPTELLRAFLTESRDDEEARLNKERQQLEEIAAAQAARELALKKAEDAQANVAAEQTRTATAQARTSRLLRIARWASAGTILLVLLAGGFVAHLLAKRAQELATKEVALAESQQQLQEARVNLDRREVALKHAQANILSELSGTKLLQSELNSALRLASLGTRLDLSLPPDAIKVSSVAAALAAAVSRANWVLTLTGGGTVTSAAFSPDGSRIVTASWDKTARIWDAATAQEIAVLRGHDSVYSAAFSPDGSRIVTASPDETARIWDAATGKEIAVLRGHESRGDFRRLQPRRVAHRHGVSGQDRPHLGRRDRQGDRGPARP